MENFDGTVCAVGSGNGAAAASKRSGTKVRRREEGNGMGYRGPDRATRAAAGRTVLCAAGLLGALLASACWTVDLTGVGGGGSSRERNGAAIGPVSGFGTESVYVGGVEFSDNSVTTVTDGQGRGLLDLVAGMVIRVDGKIEGDFRTGTASGVTIEREVLGPVDDNGVWLDSDALRVLGQSILVLPTTVMVQSGGGEFTLADLKDQLDAGNFPGLEIHGAAEDNGTIHASYIGWEQDNVVADDSVAVRGKISGFDASTRAFFVGDQAVGYNGLPSGGRVDWPVTGLANGMFVDVRGYLDAVGGGGVVRTDRTGDQIAVLSPSLGDATDRVALEGYVLAGASASFDMSVPGGTATVKSGVAPEGDAFGLRKRVRVRGTLSGTGGATVQATSVVVLKANDVWMEGAPEGVPTAGDTMTLMGKNVEVDDFTIYRDDTGAVRANFGLASLSTADTVRVVGAFDDATSPGKVVAAKVERLDVLPSGKFTLQGPVASIAAPTFTILGITVVTDALNTDYYDKGGVPIADQSAFFLKLTSQGSGTVVQVRNGAFSSRTSRIEPPSDGSRMEVEFVTVNN